MNDMNQSATWIKAASTARQISHTTIKIVTNSGSGTGFFVQYDLPDGRHAPLLVTNRHVVAGATHVVLRFTLADTSGAPIYGSHYDITVREARWVDHPNSQVDLVCLPMAQLLEHLNEQKVAVHTVFVGEAKIAGADYLGALDVLDDVAMIGYPNGLSDVANNRPIVRRGVAATSPGLDFDGHPRFVIDCACFPGSSGSPIFHYSSGLHQEPDGGLSFGGARATLIGILYAGPFLTNEGQIEIDPVPMGAGFKVFNRSMINLGFCIKATQLTAFRDMALASVAGVR